VSSIFVQYAQLLEIIRAAHESKGEFNIW